MRLDNLSEADKRTLATAIAHTVAFACRKADGIGLRREDFIKSFRDALSIVEQDEPEALREFFEDYI